MPVSFDLGDATALEGDLAWFARRVLAVALAQMRKQLHLLVVTDGGIRVGDLDASLGQLREQAFDGRAHYFRQLSYSDFRHELTSSMLFTSACACFTQRTRVRGRS